MKITAQEKALILKRREVKAEDVLANHKLMLKIVKELYYSDFDTKVERLAQLLVKIKDELMDNTYQTIKEAIKSLQKNSNLIEDNLDTINKEITGANEELEKYFKKNI